MKQEPLKGRRPIRLPSGRILCLDCENASGVVPNTPRCPECAEAWGEPRDRKRLIAAEKRVTTAWERASRAIGYHDAADGPACDCREFLKALHEICESLRQRGCRCTSCQALRAHDELKGQ